MYEFSFILLHCGDQLIGCIIWLIIAGFVVFILPVILFLGILYWVAKKFADKDERDKNK